MKKLLTLLLFLPFVVQAQESDKVQFKPNPGSQADVFVPVIGNSQPIRSHNKKPVLNHTVIGETYYDLQTNGSTPRRIIPYTDGRISVVWTNAETAGFDNRGTGYNHFDGTNWLPLTSVDYRIENEGDIQTPNRIGWPNIGHVGTTKEFTIAHGATYGGFVYSENNSIGGTSWSSTELFKGGPIWGRIAQGSNNYLYLIGAYTNPTTSGIDTPEIDGITRPVVFYRSSDNGNTWIDEAILLPGYDSTRYRFGGGDSYSIDAQDSVVAVVIGTATTDLALWKSTNYGATWTKTVVDSFPISPDELSAGNMNFDTTYHNDGSYHVVLDDNANAHVFWGMRTAMRTDDNDPGVYSYLRDSNSLGYWNEVIMERKIVARVVDEDNSGSVLDGVPRSNFGSLTNGDPAFLYAGSNLVTMPSASVDANGNLYCVYRAVVESPMDDGGMPILEANFSDIYVIYSTNGGATWSAPQNLTKSADEFTESVFPTTYRRIVNGHLHLVWQDDFAIGTAAQGQQDAAVNQIMYNAFDVSIILNDGYGKLALGVNEKNINNVFNVASTYPNPASDVVNVELNLQKGAVVNINMRNMLGQQLKAENYGKMTAGNHLLPFNTTNLKSGVYFITITADGFSSTHKVVVQ